MNQTLTYNDIRNISVSIRLSVCFSLSLHLGLSLAFYSPFSMDLSASVGLHWLSLYVTAFVSICLSLLSRSSHCPCPPACLPVCLYVSLPQLPACLSVSFCLIFNRIWHPCCLCLSNVPVNQFLPMRASLLIAELSSPIPFVFVNQDLFAGTDNCDDHDGCHPLFPPQ